MGIPAFPGDEPCEPGDGLVVSDVARLPARPGAAEGDGDGAADAFGGTRHDT